MKHLPIAFCLATIAFAANDAKVTPLMSKDLADIAGKEANMVTVEYAPGGSSAGMYYEARSQTGAGCGPHASQGYASL